MYYINVKTISKGYTIKLRYTLAEKEGIYLNQNPYN